jgi:hypothetical protein
MRKIFTLILAAAATWGATAQVVIDNTQTGQTIVEDIFLGNGIFVANVMFNGVSADVVNDQLGTFTDANNGIGIGQGLCMSTGVVAGMATGDVFGAPVAPYFVQDADILALLLNESTVNDLASLEFDFIATGDICNFQYVFASDEYPEWVESAFNDHFGFFVSGPGIVGPYSNGGVNIALIPGTTESVGINTLNAAEHSEYYIDNQSMATSVGFDAFTTVLNAHIENLVVGETYHVKLIIADVADAALDSGVFLRGDSFQQECSESGPNGVMTETCMLSTLNAEVHYTENCGTISLTNMSEMNIETTNCYYEMGDGSTTAACDANTMYTYDGPGTYTLKLVYEVGAFKAKFTVGEILISDAPPATPMISVDGDGLNIMVQNWDGVSTLQWFLNGVAISGATGVSTPLSTSGMYSVVANNGCPAESEGLQVNNIVDAKANVAFAAFPNPSDDVVNIRMNASSARVDVYNSAGQLVVSEVLRQGQVLVLDQPAGVYHINCIDGNGQTLHRSQAVVR